MIFLVFISSKWPWKGRKIETTNEVPSYITRPTRVGKGSYLQFQQKIKSSNQWSPLQSLSLTRILLNLSKVEGENMFNPDLFIYFLWGHAMDRKKNFVPHLLCHSKVIFLNFSFKYSFAKRVAIDLKSIKIILELSGLFPVFNFSILSFWNSCNLYKIICSPNNQISHPSMRME